VSHRSRPFIGNSHGAARTLAEGIAELLVRDLERLAQPFEVLRRRLGLAREQRGDVDLAPADVLPDRLEALAQPGLAVEEGLSAGSERTRAMERGLSRLADRRELLVCGTIISGRGSDESAQ
jgi:hypothetical protein